MGSGFFKPVAALQALISRWILGLRVVSSPSRKGLDQVNTPPRAIALVTQQLIGRAGGNYRNRNGTQGAQNAFRLSARGSLPRLPG